MLTGDLLGLVHFGVMRRRPGAVARACAGELSNQQLRDAEVEQLGRAVGGHEDVGRLDVAMDDQALVRVVDGGADVAEELQACGGVEPVRSQNSSIGTPSMYSITTYGRPSGVAPPSMRRAMFACFRLARICRSWRKPAGTRPRRHPRARPP